MAKYCAAFLVFLCLSMLILSFPEVDAKVYMKLTITPLSGSCEMKDFDCVAYECSEWEDGRYGNCKKYQGRIVCTCTLDCADVA